MNLARQRSVGVVAFFLFWSGALAQDVSFRYGFIGKNEDNVLFVIDDDAVLKSGTPLKINLELAKGSWFYVCYLSSDGSYSLIYSFSPTEAQDVETKYATLGWFALDQNTGTETFTLISSVRRLDELEELLRNYDRATGQSRKRFEKRIATHIQDLRNGSAGSSGIQLTRRLEKSIMGGVTFRGTAVEGLSEHSLSHESSGSQLALVTFQIQHQ